MSLENRLRTYSERVSDVHVHVGRAPAIRVDGAIRITDEAPVSPQEFARFERDHLSASQRSRRAADGAADAAVACAGARYRANFYSAAGLPALALRRLPARAPTLDGLGLARLAPAVAAHSGLILATGACGAGKSTTLAAMIDSIHARRGTHILTIEDPIEFPLQSSRALITRREVGADAPSFAAALRAALREDPDVLLVGETRDLETAELVLNAAETGHLVLTTLHAPGCAQAVGRLADMFPHAARARARRQLAEALRLIVCQRLFKRSDGAGRVAAHEILLATEAARSLIREDKAFQLDSLMQTSREAGMVTMKSAVRTLRAAGLIDVRESLA